MGLPKALDPGRPSKTQL